MDAALPTPPPAAFAIHLASERACDAAAVEALVAQAFGPGRFAKTAERVREAARFRADLSFCAWSIGPSPACHPGRSEAESRDLGGPVASVVSGSRVGGVHPRADHRSDPGAARDDNGGDGSRTLAGAVRLWSVAVGGRPALFLGPIAVAAHLRGRGIAAQLVEAACEAGAAAGETAVVLVGDLDRFGPMGFSPVPSGRIALPGPVDGRRVLWRELAPGALDGLQGAMA